MGTTSKETSTSSEAMEGYEGHFTEIGDMTVAHETYTADADLAELFKGLRGDMCHAAHYGYVITGKAGFRYADGTIDEIRTRGSYVVSACTPSTRTLGVGA
jgi:hypothetical protein